MSLNLDSSSPPPPIPSPAAPGKKKLLYGCGVLVALLLVIVATVAVTLWWIQRPIKPVVLSAQEKALIDEKLRNFDRGNSSQATSPSSSAQNSGPAPDRQRLYTPGSKALKITEREINGLLNANTDLGKFVRLEFARDAIQAYVAVPIPQDFPIGGGRMFRARGRFLLSLDREGIPNATLEDVTVFGLSLPKAWLGGIKGENLLGKAVGQTNGSPILKGIKSLHVESGALVFQVED